MARLLKAETKSKQKDNQQLDSLKKFLLIGLGNIGAKYSNTRHNIGFNIADEVAAYLNAEFSAERYADVAECSYKGKQITIIKPTTYMNLSGRAFRFYMQQKSIPLNHTLTFVDDLDLPFGKIRLKGKGSAGGHNGLKNIEQELGTAKYPRLRFGIGDNFSRGRQIDYVLGQWSENESRELASYVNEARQAALSFVHHGLSNTMNDFN